MRVVAIADLHVGSQVALADTRSPDVPKGDAHAPVRRAIFERWKEATEGPWGEPDALIVNGDIIDGQNKKKTGIGTWTTDLMLQCSHAADLIRMWRAKRVYIVRGSGYHVAAGSTGLQCEEQVARDLGAEFYPNQEHVKEKNRERSGWHWYLSLGGVTFHVSHKISVSRVFHYQSTPTAKEMLYAKLNDMLRHQLKKYKVKIVLRAHAHYFNTVGYSGSDGFVLPCWKGLDEFSMQMGAIALSPDLGFVGFNIEDGEAHYVKKLFELTDVQPAPLVVVEETKKKRRR